MKKWVCVAWLMFTAPMALADSSTFYYVGEAVTTEGFNGVKTTNPYLIARTFDYDEKTITEVATVKSGDKFEEYKSTMTVDNASEFTMEAGSVTGKGKLIGEPWRWTYLQGEFETVGLGFKMRIVDYNFFANPQAITSHKDFYITYDTDKVERLGAQEDALLHRTDEATYLLNRLKLLGHL